ncbi:MAG: hypothetical protein HKN03_17995 [Acidimicrobiales bacterium]|nr:hypothetical protein [Acidimicrobiales bacterium]
MKRTNPVLVEEGASGAAFAEPKTFSQPVVETVAGTQIPRLGFGTYRLRGDSARSMTRLALQSGVRHVDTAQMYGNEAEVGQGLADSGVDRNEVFVTTKIDNHNHEPDALVASVHESLDRLGMDQLDLLLIHWPVEWDRIGATLSQLAQVQAGGLTRHIGVSNFTIEQLEIAAHYAPLEVLQAECNPFFQQSELRDWCAKNGWVFTAYSPLGQGKALDHPTLVDIASAHDTAPSAVALAWLMTLTGVSVIPRTSSPAHLEENLAARDLVLTDNDCQRIAGLGTGQRFVDPDFAPWNNERWNV